MGWRRGRARRRRHRRIPRSALIHTQVTSRRLLRLADEHRRLRLGQNRTLVAVQAHFGVCLDQSPATLQSPCADDNGRADRRLSTKAGIEPPRHAAGTMEVQRPPERFVHQCEPHAAVEDTGLSAVFGARHILCAAAVVADRFEHDHEARGIRWTADPAPVRLGPDWDVRPPVTRCSLRCVRY